MSDRKSRLRVWLQLLRFPNLLTVPGDPWAGFFLAAGAGAMPTIAGLLACAAALCLYMAGLLLNDFADREVDRRERPNRPLPSGAVDPRAVLGTAMGLLAAGVTLGFSAGNLCGWMAMGLSILVLAYDFILKKHAFLGPAAMGACRSFSLLMGAYAVEKPEGLVWAWLGGFILFAYIASVTQVARGEMTGRPVGPWGWGPFVASALGAGVGMGAGALRAEPVFGAMPALAFLPAVVVAFSGGWRVSRASGGASVPKIIGQWIGAVILLQAAFIWAASPGCGPAAAVAGVLLWLGNRLAGRWFYSS